MVEPAGSLYSDEYNAAIRERVGSKAPNALYIEEPDIDTYYRRVRESGGRIVDALAPRPWGQREFTIEDAAGNWLTFWSKA
jgi:predicted enzyme related to lactoylglutathione lyase